MDHQRIVQLTVETPDGSKAYVHELRDMADNFDSFDQELREAIATAIRRYPNTDAAWWIGPEAVLGIIEEHLAKLSE